MWYQDKKRFAVTWSDGGAIGDFHVLTFRIDGGAVIGEPLWQQALKDFKLHHHCAARGDNIQAFAWDQPTRSLLLVLSVYPTGDCGPELGFTQGYFVSDSDGHILRRISDSALVAYRKQHPQMQ